MAKSRGRANLGPELEAGVMPQTFLAVRCCSCSAFQGIQRTQQSKYSCKLCNTKQSITRVFASGTGKEVRLAVQTLNRARLEAAAVAQPAPRPSESTRSSRK